MQLGGNYLHETPIVTAARNQGGAASALIGKVGPVAIFDGAALRGQQGLVIDDATGTPGKGVPLAQEWLKIIEEANRTGKPWSDGSCPSPRPGTERVARISWTPGSVTASP